MKTSRAFIVLLFIAAVFTIIAASYGELTGKHNILINVYSSQKGGKVIWTRTINNVDFVDGEIPFNPADLVKDLDLDFSIVYMDILIDGSSLESGRIPVTMSSSLSRVHSPSDAGEITEEMDDELQIGDTGEELYIASDVTGFGDDTPNERVTVNGAVSISHGTEPTASHGFGKIYVDGSNGHLIYLDDSGITTDLVVDGNAIQSVSSSANHTGRMDHMRFIPGEATEITESATDDTIYIRFDVDVSSTGSGGCTSAPSAPSTLYGETVVCSGEPGTSYGVVPVEDATFYQWSLPTGSTIIGGFGTSSIHAVLGNTDGNVCVTAHNACGASSSVCRAITINRPTSPGSISGPALVCRNQTGVSYNIVTVPDATNYNWTVPPGASIISGSSTPTIVVNYGTSPGEICVRTENSCGISEPECLTVGMTWTPSTPGSITGPATVCEGDGAVTYSIASVGEATTYNWTLPSGASISSGASTTTIDVDFATASGDICVSAENMCGVSAERCVTVTVQEAPAITAHPSNASVSDGDPASFSVTASGGGLTYQWEQNSGSGFVVVPGATTSTYTIASTSSSMDGNQFRCVVGNSTCSSVTSSAATLSVSVALYDFTSHTFTNCGATGQNGPNITQCRASYGTTWDDTYLSMSTTGIQEWTVPEDATYRITAVGAEGSNSTAGGNGAIMRGDFILSRGDVLKIAVGQRGTCTSYHCSGGGGSFVVQGSTPLIIAGGGGGSGDDGNGCDATTTTTSNSCSSNTNPTSTGGAGGRAGGAWGGGGGGGFSADGQDGYQSSSPTSGSRGRGWGNGLVGGYHNIGSYGKLCPGGFGGGASPTWAAGGGGGYSGGAGRYSDGSGSDHNYGGGGASYNAGTNQANSVGNTGHGYVIIQKL